MSKFICHNDPDHVAKVHLKFDELRYITDYLITEGIKFRYPESYHRAKKTRSQEDIHQAAHDFMDFIIKAANEGHKFDPLIGSIIPEMAEHQRKCEGE